MGYGNEQGEVTKPALQGGISSIYYAGSLVGGFWAGSFSDKFGRVAGIRMAALICFLGVILQTASINLPMLLVARVVAGIGVSFILCIAPAWTAELSPASHRGNTIALTFLANFTGISVAAWIGFATSFTNAAGGQFRWRFTFATQLIPVALITVGSFLIPESPRWLVKAHRHEEALEIFAHLLGDGDAANTVVQAQYRDVLQTVQAEENAPTSSYVKMFFGIGSGDVHLGRRIQLAFWLQVLMQYGTGIAAVVIYAGSIFRTAGFSEVKSSWMTALCLSVGILGTLIAALTLDRVGRRRTLYWGSIVLSIVLFLIGGLFRGALAHPARQNEFAIATVAFVFIYVLVFSSSWLLIPFICRLQAIGISTRGTLLTIIRPYGDLSYLGACQRQCLWRRRLGCWLWRRLTPCAHHVRWNPREDVLRFRGTSAHLHPDGILLSSRDCRSQS
jgi:MFS family permease